MELALVSAITALVAVVVGPIVSVHVAKRQIRASVVSASRLAWISRLRDDLAKFVRDVKHIPSAFAADALTKPEMVAHCEETLLREEVIRLSLNPAEAGHQELLRLIENARKRMLDAVNAKRGSSKALVEATQPITVQAQLILKAEWRRVKRGD